MTAPEKTAHTPAGATRKIIGWRDADYFARPEEEDHVSRVEAEASSPSVLPLGADIAAMVMAAPV